MHSCEVNVSMQALLVLTFAARLPAAPVDFATTELHRALAARGLSAAARGCSKSIGPRQAWSAIE